MTETKQECLEKGICVICRVLAAMPGRPVCEKCRHTMPDPPKEYPILFNTEMVKAILDGRKTQTRRVIKRSKMACSRTFDINRGFYGSLWRVEKHPGGGWWALNDHYGPMQSPQAGDDKGFPCPYGKPGDQLWVKEAWRFCGWHFEEGQCGFEYQDGHQKYIDTVPWDEDVVERYWIQCGDDCEKAGAKIGRDGENYDLAEMDLPTRWRSSRYMPRVASRISLRRVTEVRVERVKDISEDDACAEGVKPHCGMSVAGGKYKMSFSQLWEEINSKRGFGWGTNCWVWVVTFEVVK